MSDDAKAGAPETKGAKKGSEATQFKPGCAPGPGRPKGSRDKLQRDFLAALSQDFEQHGMDAIRQCREDNPAAYLKVLASLMPKEIDLANRRPLSDLSDEELERLTEYLRGAIGVHVTPPATVQ